MNLLEEFKIIDTENFAKLLNEIIGIAFSSLLGVNTLIEKGPLILQSLDDILEKEKEILNGFKLAQGLLIEEILLNQKILIQIKTNIKTSRTGNNKDRFTGLLGLEKLLIRRLHNLSHIADGIALKMVGEQVHIIKRLNIGEKSSKNLSESNIEHV
jgi:hypothetical protein